MAEWTATQRRTHILNLLDKGKPVVAAQLAKEFGCNEKTVRNQITRMQVEEELPIEHNRRTGTYERTQEMEPIPAAIVSEEHYAAMLFALQIADEFRDTPVYEGLRRICNELLDSMPPTRNPDEYRSLMKVVRFTGPLMPPIAPEVWRTLVLSLKAHKTVRITYTDGSIGRVTQRDIDPYGLLMCNRSWILVAHCHRYNDTRTFSPHRISAIESTDQFFEPPADFMDRYLTDSFGGMQSSGNSVQVTLRIRKDAPPFIHERIWSKKETRTQDDNGNTLVRFPTPALFILEREILANAGSVEVIEPKELRDAVLGSAQHLLRVHSTP